MKNPFTTDENSMILGMLVGLILVVFVALGLSLIVTKEISLPGSSNEAMRASNDALRTEINRLEIRIEARKRQNKQAAENRQSAEVLRELEQQLDSAIHEIPVLESLIQNEWNAIELIAKGREEHRLKYREHVRAVALGKTFDSVTNTLGTTYRDVRILGVNELGVSISHRDGAARLDYQNMPREWRDDLMYSAAEVAKARIAEQRLNQAARRHIAAQEKKVREIQQSEALRNKVERLRRSIAAVSMKLASARTESSLAENKLAQQQSMSQTRRLARSSYRYYNSSTGTYNQGYYRPRYRITVNARKSVPGSLETWDQRAAKYKRLSARYAAQLANLQRQLMSIDPSYRVIQP